MLRSHALAGLSAAFLAAAVVTAGASSAGTGMCSFVDVSIQFCHTQFGDGTTMVDPSPFTSPNGGAGATTGTPFHLPSGHGGAHHAPGGPVHDVGGTVRR
jgi:hypothetical protein